MKRTLTALTVAASLIASGASAFETNISLKELLEIQGTPIVGDLNVGIRAFISSRETCQTEGRLYLSSLQKLETDPSEYLPYYEITKQPDGGFTVSFGPTGQGKKRLPPSFAIFKLCPEETEAHPYETFYPIKSINGFTDLRSFWVDLLNQGYGRGF